MRSQSYDLIILALVIELHSVGNVRFKVWSTMSFATGTGTIAAIINETEDLNGYAYEQRSC